MFDYESIYKIIPRDKFPLSDMNTELIESVMESLDEINEKLEDLNLRMNRIDRGNDAMTKDVKKLRQSMELLQSTICSKMQG